MASAGSRLRGDIASSAVCDGLLPMGGVTRGEGGSFVDSSSDAEVVLLPVFAFPTPVVSPSVGILPVDPDRVDVGR